FLEILVPPRLPPLRQPAFSERPPASALYLLRHRYAGEVEQRGREIDVEHHLMEHLSLGGQLRVTYEEGNAQAFLVGRTLVAETVLAQVVPVVAREDDDRVLDQAQLVEGGEQSAQVVVGRGDAAEVVQAHAGPLRFTVGRASLLLILGLLLRDRLVINS